MNMEMTRKEMVNSMKIEFDARSENEGFARVAVASFMTTLDPTLEEVEDVKTAVSEAVTNCIIHGYEIGTAGGEAERENIEGDTEAVIGNVPKIYLECFIQGKEVHIEIRDNGVGIANIKEAMEPLYTSKPELERSGMGFAFMEAFMDSLTVESVPGQGTKVNMVKKLGEYKDFLWQKEV